MTTMRARLLRQELRRRAGNSTPMKAMVMTAYGAPDESGAWVTLVGVVMPRSPRLLVKREGSMLP